MLTDAPAPNGITVHLLSQIEGTVDSQPIVKQPDEAAIAAQAAQVAERFAAFVDATRTTLDICIYDFRLELPAISHTVVTAINAAADRGVAVRVAYDANETSDEEIIKQFRGAGGDPAPTGTHDFLKAALDHRVATQAIAEEPTVPAKVPAEEDATPALNIGDEPITTGGHIMHHKYMISDAEADSASVWMGSTNFTVDAWALQENNVVVLASKDLAARYTQDFNDLWQPKKSPEQATATKGLSRLTDWRSATRSHQAKARPSNS